MKSLIAASKQRTLKGIGRHGKNGSPLAIGQTTVLPRGLKTVHTGHLHIHEDEVIVIPAGQVHGLNAILSNIDG